MLNPRNLVLLLVTLATFAGYSYAQTVSGIIAGSVFDPGGLPIAGAAVSLTNADTGDHREMKTEPSGEFVFSSVLPGRYTVAVEAKGFKRLEKTDLNITQAERLSAGNLKLEVGGVSESITVSASGTAVDIENNDNSQILTGDQMEELQSRGRNYMALFNVLPGSAPDERFFETDAMQSYLTPNFSGIASTANSIFVDGATASSVGNANYSTTNVAMDSVGEVKVEQGNYRAEDGRNGGAVIKTTIKSGTRQFHGGVYEFERNDFFNANSFINNENGVARSRYRYHTFGGTLGGPIALGNFNKSKEKLFFFLGCDLEPTYSPSQQPLTQLTMPTALERNGDFSQTLTNAGVLVPIQDPLNNKVVFPGNIIPTSRIDKAGQALLNLFPLPNFTNRAISKGNYNFNFIESPFSLTNSDTVKVDYNISSNLRIFATLINWRDDSDSYRNSGQSWPEVKSDYHERFKTGSIHGSYTASPTLVFELTIGMRGSPNWYTAEGSLSAVQRSALGVPLGQFFPQVNPNSILPQMSFGGVPDAPAFGGGNILNLGPKSTEPLLSITPSVSKVTGNHTLKAGAFGERPKLTTPSSGNFAGSLAFASDTNNALNTNYAFSNALTGTYQSYSETQGRPQYDIRGLDIEWYVQDTWKATKRLTLDYGMRFTWFSPYKQANDQSLNFIPSLYSASQAVVLYRPALVGTTRMAQNPLTGATLPIIYLGALVPNVGNPVNGTISQSSPGVPDGFVKNPGVLYGPRFGFAYDLTGDGKTALRGGFGTTYNIWPNPGTLEEPTVSNTQNSFTNYYGTLESLTSVSGTLFPRTLTGLNPNAKVPTIYSFSFNIQRSLGAGMVLSVAYAGTQARQLQVRNGDVDVVPFGAEFLPSSHDSTNNSTITLPVQQTSNYNSMQTQVQRRFTKGIQFGGAWTYSKAMGNAAGACGQYYSCQLNYGKLSIDHTHLLSLNYLYELPKASRLWNVKPVKWMFDGWQTSSIVTFASGRPWGVTYSVTNGVNITGGGDYSHAVMVGSPNLAWSDRSINHFFNTSAFAMAPQIVGSVDPGNAPVDNIHGPGRNNWDMTFSKNVHIGEHKTFQLRWELYNIFNHPSFYQLNVSATFAAATGVQTNAAFGQLTNTLTPRVMQLAGKFNF